MEPESAVCGTLFCSEDSVAGIAKSWADISVLVQLAVNMTNVELDVRMSLEKSLNSLRCSDDRHELDVLATVLLDEINGSNC